MYSQVGDVSHHQSFHAQLGLVRKEAQDRELFDACEEVRNQIE